MLAWTVFYLAFFLLVVPGLTALLPRAVGDKLAGVLLRVVQLTALFAPLLWYAQWGPSPGAEHAQEKFLLTWVYVYFVFFSLSETKLPNYILPLYPPMALLTARFLDRWRCGILPMGDWVMKLGLACWALMGAGACLALLVAAGKVELPFVHIKVMPGLEEGAFLGTLLLLGAGAAWLCIRRGAALPV